MYTPILRWVSTGMSLVELLTRPDVDVATPTDVTLMSKRSLRYWIKNHNKNLINIKNVWGFQQLSETLAIKTQTVKGIVINTCSVVFRKVLYVFKILLTLSHIDTHILLYCTK